MASIASRPPFRTLYHQLDVQTVQQLARAAHDGRVRALPGFGEKTEAAILQALQAHLKQQRRFKLVIAGQYAEPLKEHLKQSPAARQVIIAGSYRRFRETVGDLDILVTTSAAAATMDHFTS